MNPNAGRRRPLLMLFLLLPGAALTLVSVTADWIGIGSPGYGRSQIFGTIAGLLLALLGWVLHPRVAALLEKSCRPSLSLKKWVLFTLTIWVLLFLLGEAIVRITGHRPWQVPELQVSVEPGGKFFGTDPALGYAHLPGRFRIILTGAAAWDTYSWTCTHGPDTLRITSPTDSPRESDKLLWIFGCSLTHGWSVNDEETYPWLLQEKLREYHVVNFGVSGYGTVHSWIQFTTAIERGQKPDVVVVAYGSIHDERNTFLRRRRKAVVPYNKLGSISQPYARLDSEGNVRLHAADAVYTELFGMRYSALIHSVEQVYNNRIEDLAYGSHEVSKAILKSLADACAKNDVMMIVAGIMPDQATSDTLDYCKRNGIRAFDMSVNFSTDSRYNNLPYDLHPNARAHQEYAEKLYSYLVESRVLQRN